MIVDGKALGCWWGAGSHGAPKRTKPIRGVVWHWTAGEGRAESVAKVLQAKGLSIHFVIDADGRIVMMADPATTVCYHAGSRVNPEFVGVEIVNRGVAPSLPKRNRPERDTVVRGRKMTGLDFTPEQYASVAFLADALSVAHGIPRICATGTDTFTPAELAQFRGHLEHLHVSPRKVDSGGFIMDHLRRHWNV